MTGFFNEIELSLRWTNLIDFGKVLQYSFCQTDLFAGNNSKITKGASFFIF